MRLSPDEFRLTQYLAALVSEIISKWRPPEKSCSEKKAT